jgi:hypothetical protein
MGARSFGRFPTSVLISHQSKKQKSVRAMRMNEVLMYIYYYYSHNFCGLTL